MKESLKGRLFKRGFTIPLHVSLSVASNMWGLLPNLEAVFETNFPLSPFDHVQQAADVYRCGELSIDLSLQI